MRLELVHGIGEVGAVADHPPVHEDRHVPAQRRLVVEHVAARLGIVGKDVVQHFAHRAPGSLGFRAGDVALHVGREHDLGHHWYSFRAGPRVRSTIPQHARSKGATERVEFPTSWEKKRRTPPAAGYLGGNCLFSVKQPVPPIPTRMAIRCLAR